MGGTSASRAWLDPGQVDCPAGLARCVGGTVEVAQPFRHPSACSGNPEACQCPWAVVAACDAGCAASGAEVALPEPLAKGQLCAPRPGEAPVGRAPSPGIVLAPPPGACEGDPFACVGGLVVACDAVPRLVAQCTRGCVGGASTQASGLSDVQAVTLLCQR